MPDLPLCLGVLKHRASLVRGGRHLSAKIFLDDGFLLIWCNLKFEGVLFQSDSRHNDRVDSLWECATKSTSFRVQARGLICPKSCTGGYNIHNLTKFTKQIII